MADPYLAISQIAMDGNMNARVVACTTQQKQLDNIDVPDAQQWAAANAFLWASSPSWGEKWKYAQDSHTDDPTYEPGADEAVITDADILATVQALAPAPPGNA